jgi:phosphonate transport system ATP-binding protein
VGPSGAGKTTLLKSMVFALRPSSGNLFFEYNNPWLMSSKTRHQLRTKIFLSTQVPHLPPRQRVVTAVMAGKLASMSTFSSLISLVYPQDLLGVKKALNHFGLEDKLYERVDRLSGGERQRVSLARAIISKSKLWALDEPLSSLDPKRAEDSLENLIKVASERNLTFISSLHQIDFALNHFPRIIGIKSGSVLFDCVPSKVSNLLLDRLYATNI